MLAHPLSSTPRTLALSWLWRIYDYIGAHTKEPRFENERDRGRHRVAIPVLAILWILGIHVLAGTSIASGESHWILASCAYVIGALCFWTYLKLHPRGGVHIQYAFMAMDPLLIGWALYAIPQLIAWFLVLLLVTIVRTGFRYGINAMKIAFGLAWLGAAFPLLFYGFHHLELGVAASLLLTLCCAWGLFAPLVRSVEKAKQLEIDREIERTRLVALQDSLIAKSEFLSCVGHELRSPLQGVVSALDVIDEHFSGNPAQAELLSRVRHGATAINTQLRDLLTLARGDAGKMEINAGPFEVVELVETVARQLRPEAEAKGLELLVEVPTEPIFAVSDPSRIDQVLTNLLSNATRHTHHGTVRLKLHPFNEAIGSLEFEVLDTGPGISKEHIPTLFDPFTRFGNLNPTSAGSGLGLAIVRSVLHFLGGQILVTSETGRGSAFSVSIPAQLLSGDSPRGGGQSSGLILVVDDRKEVLEGIAGVIERLGFQCLTAMSSASAALHLGIRKFDLVFLDLNMPVKCGYDLATDIRRSTGLNRETCIFSISAADLYCDKQGWPFDGHLSKPISRGALQRAIFQSGIAATGQK